MPSRDKAPRTHRLPQAQKPRGLVMVNTGDGKGKSTAAFGTALRALGQGRSVAVVQFIKGKWKTGEEKAARFFGKKFQFHAFGEGFTWQTKDFEKDTALARRGWKKAAGFIRDKKHSLVILDEINCCFLYNFLDVRVVLRELKKRPVTKHVFLTGRGAPAALMRYADLVTEMKNIKHPYDKGFIAQAGIDF